MPTTTFTLSGAFDSAGALTITPDDPRFTLVGGVWEVQLTSPEDTPPGPDEDAQFTISDFDHAGTTHELTNIESQVGREYETWSDGGTTWTSPLTTEAKTFILTVTTTPASGGSSSGATTTIKVNKRGKPLMNLM